MKKRKIAIKPAETLEILLPDGTTREAIFNVEALIILQEAFGDPQKLAREFEDKPHEFTARILYSGIAVLDSSITFDEAKAIVVGGGIELLATIMEMFAETFGDADPEELKKNLIPVMNRQLRRQQAKKKRKK